VSDGRQNVSADHHKSPAVKKSFRNNEGPHFGPGIEPCDPRSYANANNL
jgi:hypothetical protein